MSGEPNSPPSDSASSQLGRCTFCLGPLGDGEPVVECPGCRARYHQECWDENGGCAAYGCTNAPAVEPRRTIEIPFSHWGQEHKACPACGQQILAAAVRCRHCGATFASAGQDATGYHTRTALEAELPGARRTIIVIFLLSVIPISAPIGCVYGILWWYRNRVLLPLLSSLHVALLKIGVGAALVWTLAVVVATALYVALRGA